MPFALKDLFDTAGIPTTGQSRIARDRVPSVDATVTSRLHDAGAVLLGKLALHELAHGGPSLDLPWPLARNRWNRAKRLRIDLDWAVEPATTFRLDDWK